MVVNTTPLTVRSVALIRSVSGVESYSDKILYELVCCAVPTAKKVLCGRVHSVAKVVVVVLWFGLQLCAQPFTLVARASWLPLPQLRGYKVYTLAPRGRWNFWCTADR